MDLRQSFSRDVSVQKEELMKFGSHPLLDHEDVKTEENFNTRLAAIQRRRPFV